jgi:hypothetical protein
MNMRRKGAQAFVGYFKLVKFKVAVCGQYSVLQKVDETSHVGANVAKPCMGHGVPGRKC